jgi:uncharacterized membrane protein YfcA
MAPMSYSLPELSWIALSVFMLGMSKGGLPVGVIALPMLVLAWPARSAEPARTAVAFMLPALCAMDIVAVAFYRRHIIWSNIARLFPAAIAGIVVGSIFFVARDTVIMAVSDRTLKIWIGVLGLLFVVYQAAQRWIFTHLGEINLRSYAASSAIGFVAGLSSTIAHAAGPVVQIYLLPQKLEKMNFAAAYAAFFFVVNFIKLVPFVAFGRIETQNLLLAAYVLPAIVLGVPAGYILVKIMKPKHYIGFIYTILTVASVSLIVKAIGN